MDYSKVLLDKIDDERAAKDYIYQGQDKAILEEMFDEINNCFGTNYHYLAEIDAFNIMGSGIIMAKYIDQYQSESVRSYLIPQIVADKVDDGAYIVLKAYLHFKNSSEYISPPNKPSPAHISTRYDNAFRSLKPKKIKEELSSLAYNPRDAFYLPFTMRMLASWKISDLERVFISYLDESTISNESVGLPQNASNYYPAVSFIRRQLKFTAIECLKYYPSDNTIKQLNSCLNDFDKDINKAINKTVQFLCARVRPT